MDINNVKTAKKNLDPTQKTVFISGVTGQDGSLMVDYLLQHTTHNIVGGARRISVENHLNIGHLETHPRFQLVYFDLTDPQVISSLVTELQPDYFINLAAQTFVQASWECPVQTWDTNTTGVLYCLEAIRQNWPTCRFYNAGSSEEFGNISYSPQDENHPLRPRSPYAASKAGARQLVKVYRESYGLFAIQAWLFNHEGERRGKDFVTRKITKGVARIHAAINFYESGVRGISPLEFDPIELGFLDAKRDWSDAEDMVGAIWAMLNNDTPKEYVVSSGENHPIREFVEIAFQTAGIDGTWKGDGVECTYENSKYGVIVKVNPKFYRPAEVNDLLGDNSKILADLGWKPATSFRQLVEKMVRKDIQMTKI